MRRGRCFDLVLFCLVDFELSLSHFVISESPPILTCTPTSSVDLNRFLLSNSV